MTHSTGPNAGAAWGDQIESLIVSPPDGLPTPAAIGAATSGALIGRLAAAAARLLPKFATGTVKLVRRGEVETGDPLKPFNDEVQRYPRHSYVGGYPSDRVDNVNVMASDLRIICGADRLPIKPTAADGIEIDQKELSIVRVTAIPAAGAPILYVLQARAA